MTCSPSAQKRNQNGLIIMKMGSKIIMKEMKSSKKKRYHKAETKHSKAQIKANLRAVQIVIMEMAVRIITGNTVAGNTAIVHSHVRSGCLKTQMMTVFPQTIRTAFYS